MHHKNKAVEYAKISFYKNEEIYARLRQRADSCKK